MKAIRTVYVADALEHALVCTRVDLTEDETRIPAGSIGTIVLAVPEKDGFEIEFDAPVRTVTGAWRDQIEPV